MRILLAVDGSKASFEAVEALAHFSPSEHMIILNVLEVPSSDYQSFRFILKDLPDIVGARMHREAEKMVEGIASSLSPRIGEISQYIEKGNPAQHILDLASRSKVDLIVLGARGLNRLSELVFGSVSHRVMTYANCSTLIVKSPLPRLQQVLLPVKGSEDTTRAAAFLAKTPFRERPTITVLHAVPVDEAYWLEGAMMSESYREELMVAGKVLTDQAVTQLTDMGYQAESLVRYGPPAELIQATVDENTPDLIVLGSNGRKGVSRFFMGSVSHSVVHRSPCSVLVVR